MSFGNKSGRSEASLIESASGYFEKPVAGPALKVMVMLFPGYFIEDTSFGRVDSLQPPGFHQDFQVAIDCCLVEGADSLPAGLEYFIDTQRPVYLPEDFLYCITLIRVSFHSNPRALHPSCTPALLQAHPQYILTCIPDYG
jgi:hypothetical protein